ncbi:toll/interleukin-1 receptor domain-containing protein [Streptosporangium amethystogenes subsp. fukuiense]|uniref:Toll/interleukin-1 receptor domain-containing protein n=1 Tax=Streptosporangium amethystogenes subsp. fukuiense TaxID=698418 RepID=A0ABW2SV19_9ACTN
MAHEVFINYRTGDGEKIAALLHEHLSKRFEGERTFLASASIPPGETYPDRLLSAVRRSSVVLAVIGEGWSQHSRLHDEDDWVRKEILEAFKCGIEVIPVLDGRKVERLNVADLPQELVRLADVQSVRLDLHEKEAGLKRIGDQLARKLPSLKEVDRATREPQDADSVSNSVNEAHGTVVQTGNFTGDAGTVIKGNQGPVHSGNGDLNNNSPHASGPGATYIAGDNQGGIRHDFGGSRRDEDDDR